MELKYIKKYNYSYILLFQHRIKITNSYTMIFLLFPFNDTLNQ